MTTPPPPKPRTSEVADMMHRIKQREQRSAPNASRTTDPTGKVLFQHGDPNAFDEIDAAQTRPDTPNSRIAFTNSPMEEDSTISSIFTQAPVAISEETREAFAAYARCEGGPENWPPRTRQQSARTRTRVNGASLARLAFGGATPATRWPPRSRLPR